MIELKHLYEQRGYYITDLSAERCLVGFSPGNVDFITYVVHNLVPLEEEDINKIILEALEQCKLICREIKIIAKGGLVNRFNSYCYQGVYVYDYQYLDDLRSEKFIELFAHNEFVYEKIKKHFNNNRFGAIVQATGTGKSYLIARYISEISINDRVIVLVPNTIISDEIKKALGWEYANVEFFTFQGLSRKNITQLKAAYIIIDEFHHSESEVWGGSIKGLIRNNPEARVFGTTATPVRPSDDVNVVDTLFKGKLINELNLSTAIHAQILPCPKIIQSVYNIKTIIDEYHQAYHLKKESMAEKQKEHIGMILNKMMLNVDSFSVASILSRHIKESAAHVLVFCSSIEELQNMKDAVNLWFQDAGFDKIEVYTVHSDKTIKRNKEIIKDFQDKREGISLLFSVDMLSEGMHLRNVDAAIFLRKTSSYIVCLQQLGRTLKAGTKGKQPIILDLVNNINSKGFIKNHVGEVFYPSGQTSKSYDKRDIEVDIDEILIEDVIAQLKEVEEIWNPKSMEWNRKFEELKLFVELNGTYPHFQQDKEMYKWVSRQRQEMKNGKLSDQKIELLNSIDFKWGEERLSWEERFEELKLFVELNGAYPTSSSNKILSTWVSWQRKEMKNRKLSDQKIELLNSIDFKWREEKISWEERFEELKLFVELNGTYPTSSSNKILWMWVSRQRKEMKNGKLSDQRIELLNSINFRWGERLSWEERFEELKLFVELNGTYPTSSSNKILWMWMSWQRKEMKNRKLSDQKIELLNSINFRWGERLSWEERFEELKLFVELNRTYPTSSSNKILWMWMSWQRKEMKNRKLSDQKIELLNSINFRWEERSSWEERFEELKLFVELNGAYPTSSSNKILSTWVSRQRKEMKNGKLSDQRIELLNSINFKWSVYKTAFIR